MLQKKSDSWVFCCCIYDRQVAMQAILIISRLIIHNSFCIDLIFVSDKVYRHSKMFQMLQISVYLYIVFLFSCTTLCNQINFSILSIQDVCLLPSTDCPHVISEILLIWLKEARAGCGLKKRLREFFFIFAYVIFMVFRVYL